MKTPTSRFIATPMDFVDLRILGMGLHDQMPSGVVHRPYGLGSYLLALFHTEATIHIQSVAHRCPPQSLIVWEPDTCQHYGNTAAPWEYSWVICDGPFFQSMRESLAIPCNIVLTLTDPFSVDHVLQDLHREYTRSLHPNSTLVRNLLHNGLIEVQRQLALTGTTQSLPEWVATIKQYLEVHYAESISLAQLADYAHFSVAYFCRQFAELFGTPPMEYLSQIRMRAAKFLLFDDNLSISDVAMRTGYDNYTYFSTLFRRRYGMSPREMRKGLCGEAGKQQRTEERRSRALAYWLREGWQVVLDYDFAHTTHLDPRLHCFWGDEFSPRVTAPHMADIIHGALRLHPNRVWTGICWEDTLTEELKVEMIVLNDAPDGVNLAIAISGDLWNGYRLRLAGYNYLALETTINGAWEILQRYQVALDPQALEYHIVYWRADNIFYVEIDGHRIIEYHEPFAPQGELHRGFTIARFYDYGSADVRALRVYARITPRYVDILEPGRVLLREGYRESAVDWFRRIREEHTSEVVLQQEAAYLIALAVPDAEYDAKEEAFVQATADTTSPFHQRLLRQWACTRLERGDLTGAIDMVLACAQRYADHDTPHFLAEKITASFSPRMSPAALEHALVALARLPLTRVHLPAERIVLSLAPLQGMALRELRCGQARIADLSPLSGMPLEYLEISGSAITDLTPLAHMPLISFECTDGRLRDLTPLRGLPLQRLTCPMNDITDISPVAGLPLTFFDCSTNRVHDLTPVRELPLKTLRCSNNAIQELAPLRGLALQTLLCANNQLNDLTPLIGQPLQTLNCAGNRISDLSPVCGMPLSVLDCDRNAITDLSPLAGLPLKHLTCAHNPVTSLQPLCGMAIEDLAIEGIPLHPDNQQCLQTLPLRHLACDLTDMMTPLLHTHPTLEGLNHHNLAYLREMQEVIRQAVMAWRHADTSFDQRPALDQYATHCGTVRYLVVPSRFSRSDAEAFSTFYGATLACPSTPEQFLALHAYLASISYYGSEAQSDSCGTSYHLGLVSDPRQRTFRWLSGQPYQWQNWRDPDAVCLYTPGIPYFFTQPSVDASYWLWDSNTDGGRYVVLQWP